MSTTIENRVLEMRFDNKQFESSVATSMSTLDKLKQKLNLSGASKGLNDINAAAKKFDMSGMGSAVETVSAKFSALQVMGVTALANITNSAVNAGKRIVSALTIDPVKSGFQEYETQINSVQTILANTQHEGTNLKQVNAALDELNKYADKTIYNFTEMTRNIGTFTAAGVDLNTSVDSIKGIANLAAVSGSTSQQASTAMYQLSQALAAGKVSLMDWNSVVNAGMGGKVFQDALVRTSELLGTGAKGAINMYGSFRESLTKGEWLTTEVLTETLKQFAGAYSEADLIAQGFTETQAKEIAQMAKTADEAATKVKTFSQLWDVMKEAAQSGWAQTWRLIVGDFEEAKALLTPLADFFTNAIGKMSDARNKLLEGALGSPFGKMIKEVSGFTKTTKETVETVKDLGDVVNKVINGDFGNGEERFNKLTEAGYNWMEVQNKVNEKLGNSHRYTQEEIEAQDKLLATKKKVIDGEEKTLGQLAKMSDAKLKDAGMTEEQIKALRELEKQAKKSGMSIDDFVKKYDGMDGRTMIIETLKNAGSGLVGIFKAIGKAWREVFDPMTSEQLYGIIQRLYEMSSSLRLTDAKTGELTATAKKFQRTFKGVFAALDIVRKILGGGLKISFEILKQVLAAFDMDILDVTANIGDAIYKFNEWLESNSLIKKGVELIIPAIIKMAKAIGGWTDAFKELPIVQKAIKRFSSAFETAKDAVSDFIENIDSLTFDDILNGLKTIKDAVKSAFSDLFDGVGEDTIAGLINGLKDGIGKAASVVIEIGTSILNAIKNVLGIHSPSTEMHEVGENTIDGLYNGLKAGISKIVGVVKEIADNIIDAIGKIDWNKVFAGGAVVGIIVVAKKIADALGMIASPLVGFGEMMSGVGGVLEESAGAIKKVIKNFAKIEKSFSKVMNSFAFKTRAEGIKELAIAIAIIAGAIAILSLLDPKKLWNAVAMVAVLALVLAALAVAMEKLTTAGLTFDKDSKKLNMKSLSSGLMGIAMAVMVLAYAVKIMGSLEQGQLIQGFAGLVGIISAIALVMTAFWGLSKLFKGSTADFAAMGSSLLKMSVAMLLMVGVVKLAGSLTAEQALKGAGFAAAFVLFVGGIVAVTKVAKDKEIAQVGGLVLKLSIAMLLLVGVVKLVGKLSPDEMKKGAAFAGAFLIFVSALTVIARFAGTGAMGKLSGLVLSITFAMGLMVGVIKLIDTLSGTEVLKGIAFAALFTIFVAALVKVTTIGNDQQTAKMTTTILAISVAIAILAGVCILLGMIDIPSLAKGVIAVGILGAIMTAMIWATRGANDVKGSLIAMTVAIGIMAAAVVILSFIDPTKLAGATAAMGILMGIFTLMVKVAGTAQMAMGPLIVMAVVVALFGTILFLLAKLPVESTLGVATSLSIMLLAMAAAFAILGTFGALAGTAIAGAIGMMAVVAIVGGLALAIGALMSLIPQDKIEEWKTGLQNFMDFIVILAGGLGEALGAFIGGAMAGIMSGLPAIADSLSSFMDKLQPFLIGIKMVDGSVLEGVGILTATIIALTAAQLINGLTSFLDFAPSLSDLGSQLSAFAINLLPFLAAMKLVDPSAIDSVTNLGLMIAALTGSTILDGIASFITGTSSMEKFGEQLTQFADAVIPFSNKLNEANINEAKIQAATNAGLLMAELGKAIPKSGGFLQDIIGESDWTKFNAGITSFGDAIVLFNDTLGTTTIDEAKIQAAVNAGKALTEVQKAIPKSDGFLQDIIGESDWTKFNTSIVAFGDAIVLFNNTISATEIDEGKIETAVNAGKALAKVQKAIPKSDGFLQDIIGESDWNKFNTSIVAFGDAIIAFNNNIGEAGIEDANIQTAVKAGEALIAVQEAIPEEHWLDGKVSLDDFAEKIEKFGEGISNYSDSVSEVDTGKVSSSITAANRIVSLAKKLVDLDPTGIDNFKAKKIGSAMKDYSNKVKDIDAGKVSSSVNSAKKLISLIKSLTNLDTSGISKFKVSDIGKTMKGYSDSVSGIKSGAISSSITAATRLKNFINSLANLDTSGVSSFKSAISSLGKTDFNALAVSLKGAASSKFTTVGADIVNAIVKGFKSKQSTLISTTTTAVASTLKAIKNKAGAFNQAGSTLGSKFVLGLRTQSAKAASSITSAVSSAASAIRGYWSSFYSAGTYLGSGLVSGINAKQTAAYNAGFALGQAAVQGEKDGQRSNSPSKLTIQAGKWLGEGLVIGINKMGSKVYNAGHDLGEYATKSLSSAISKVSDFVESGIDPEPTIRPVLDLSGVASGVGEMNGMLHFNPAIGMSSNLNAIKTMMNRRNQNGTNADVVTAINKLRKDMGDLDRNTYIIDGVTYDDGSNVSDAVRTIIRAARIERRS